METPTMLLTREVDCWTQFSRNSSREFGRSTHRGLWCFRYFRSCL